MGTKSSVVPFFCILLTSVTQKLIKIGAIRKYDKFGKITVGKLDTCPDCVPGAQGSFFGGAHAFRCFRGTRMFGFSVSVNASVHFQFSREKTDHCLERVSHFAKWAQP